MEISDIKDIAIVAKPFIDPIIASLISPKITKLKKWAKEKQILGDVSDNYFENKFKDYLDRTYKNCSILNVLVFPNRQIRIKDLYQPLTLVLSEGNEDYKVEKFEKSFIEKYQNILISDNAGMGKSTLMKWISISLIEEGISIPILIELKKIKRDHKILDEIFTQIDPIDKSFDKELILKFLELGSFTVLLDGFDEIEHSEREEVINDIKNFVSKASKNWFILTSRHESELSSFGNFQLQNIKPLEKKEAFELIRKYDGINKSKLSSKLITGINEKFSQVEEFLTNPFLISLLYKTYTYNKDIPSKKSTFYDEVYSALYKHHDLSKDGYKRNKKSGLDIYDFRLVLRSLAFNTSKEVKIEYTEHQLISYLKQVNEEISGIEFKELSYSEDLELNVPLFVRDGRNLKWAHKSVQDYFAAEFICNDSRKAEIVTKIYESKKANYLLILDFISELEPQIFREVIVLKILKKYVEFCESSFQNVEASKAAIRNRQAFCFGILYGVEEGDEITRYLSKFHEQATKEFGEFSLSSLSLSHSPKGFITEIFATSFDQELVNIIGSKGSKYTRKLDNEDEEKSAFEIKIPKNKLVLMNDEPECIFNKKRNFNKVNHRLFNIKVHSRFGRNTFILDYDSSKKEIAIIEGQIKSRKENDILHGI